MKRVVLDNNVEKDDQGNFLLEVDHPSGEKIIVKIPTEGVDYVPRLCTLNHQFAHTILFIDPETGEELRLTEGTETTEEGVDLVVENKDGSRRWKHTIKTEEV